MEHQKVTIMSQEAILFICYGTSVSQKNNILTTKVAMPVCLSVGWSTALVQMKQHNIILFVTSFPYEG